jgi:DNA-binding transcriptional MerR regulator
MTATSPHTATVEHLTVGQVAEQYGVTVRTLHHYDEIGLLQPSGRTHAGYRLYDTADLRRLASIVVYRRLGLPLDEVAALMSGHGSVVEHLRRQRDAVLTRLDELSELVSAIDRALEAEMSDTPTDPAELKEIFGDGWDESYADEAEQRWGQTEAWRQSARRTARYTRADWVAVKAEAHAATIAMAEALAAGEPATSIAAMDAAEAHRRHIHNRFYDCSYAMHRGLGDMYLADPRFTATYENIAAGLAQYTRDAIHANADRHDQG